MSNSKLDRYVTFCNIDCDKNADRLVAMLRLCLEQGKGGSQWRVYFQQKLEEQVKLMFDILRLIGNQTNPLYEYFEKCKNQPALDLLSQIEMECL